MVRTTIEVLGAKQNNLKNIHRRFRFRQIVAGL
jgi:hypothetical protein